MDARTAELEQHKLLTESSEHAYSDDTVVHTTQKSGLSEVRARWKREKEVGAGAFGTVWLEKDETGELRAVKCLPRTFKVDFLREVHVLAELREHRDHFVHFLGWFEDKEFIFIAMEYTECGDLRKYITDSGPNARREVRKIMGQLLEGLVVLHGKGICHRDLNPQNILIASFSPISVKIADFGVSKREIDTELRTQCGTPGYRAPEQQGILPREFMAGRSYTNAADLWALGSVLHEILTSEIPFLYYEVNPGTALSGLEAEGVAQMLDTALLWRYCHGSCGFPTASLNNSVVGKEGIDFVKRLLIVDPRCRISALEALKSPWLLEENDSETLRTQFLSLGVELSLKTLDLLVAKASRRYITEVSIGDIGAIWHAGASNGYILLVKSLIESIDDIDIRVHGMTSLQAAAAGGHVDVVELLLSTGAEVNAKPAVGGRTALQAAAGGGHVDVVKLLLDTGAKVNAKPAASGQTALQAAAMGGYVGVVQLLLDTGAKVNAKPAANGHTALQAAARGGYVDVVQLLLDTGAEVNAKPAANGQTALQAAARGGYVDVVQLLLDTGAEVNAKPVDNGRTALQAAAGGGHVDVVKLLLNTGAEVNAEPARGGRTALQAAAGGGHVDVVKLLLDTGAEVNAEPARGGRTALQPAVRGGYVDVVKLLLGIGAEVNAELVWGGRTALQAAAGGGHVDVANYGLTALQAAAESGHVDVVKLLLGAGAEVNAKSADSSQTALQAAAENGHVDVVRLFVDNGVDVKALSVGWTALTIARMRRHSDVAELLDRITDIEMEDAA